MAKISDVRNTHKTMHFIIEFECEERRQFELTPEALACLEEKGLIPEVDESLGLTRRKWKKANQPKSSGSMFVFNDKAQTIGKSQL
jgi:hypothetical protein